jgi:hypothetical protein
MDQKKDEITLLHDKLKSVLDAKNKSTLNSLGILLKERNSLVEEFWEDVVESAAKSIEVITKFLNRKPSVDEVKIRDICNILKESKNRWYNDFNPSSANSSEYAYHDLIYQEEIFSTLKEYFSKNSLVADVFCWTWPRQGAGCYSSLRWEVGILSLLWVNKALFVDLFHQNNAIEENKSGDDHYWYKYVFGANKSQEFMTWKIHSTWEEKESIYPDFTLFSVKLDALGALKAMPDNSLDGMMINDVDKFIVNKPWYEELFWAEVKRVVKNKWLVFWFATDIRPSYVDSLINDGRLWWRAFENKK